MLRALMLVLVTLSSVAFAATNDVTRETEGYGATQQEAVANALVEAVRQVRGSAAGVDRSIAETMAVVAGAGGTVIEKTAKPAPDVYTESHGFVRSYQVLEQRATEKGIYVRIRAVVPAFESAISDDGRKRIAILPFRVSIDGYRLADHGNAMVFSQRLADRLVSEMAQQKDVVVINRDFFAELGLEKAVLGADAAPEELTKLGASVSADFLLVGRVQEARTEVEEGAYGGKPKKTDEVRIAWRMIEAATGKVLNAGDVSFDNFRKEQNRYSWHRRDDFEASLLFSALAKQVVDATLMRAAAPAIAPGPAADEPATELTPGSSEKPLAW